MIVGNRYDRYPTLKCFVPGNSRSHGIGSVAICVLSTSEPIMSASATSGVMTMPGPWGVGATREAPVPGPRIDFHCDETSADALVLTRALSARDAAADHANAA